MSTFFLRFLLIFIVSVGSISCSGTESSVYHWQGRGNIGPNKFVQDHNFCIREADSWPFDTSPYAMFDSLSPGPHDPKNRMDPEEGKVWASFIPYRGAQPIYVNDFNGSTMVDGEEYAECMESLGYKEALPKEIRNNLIYDRKAGYRGEY